MTFNPISRINDDSAYKYIEELKPLTTFRDRDGDGSGAATEEAEKSATDQAKKELQKQQKLSALRRRRNLIGMMKGVSPATTKGMTEDYQRLNSILEGDDIWEELSDSSPPRLEPFPYPTLTPLFLPNFDLPI